MWRRFDFQVHRRAVDPQPDRSSFPNRRFGDSLLADKDAVGALEIADIPPTVFQGNFGVRAADVFVPDADLAVIGAPNAKSLFEVKFAWLAKRRGHDDTETLCASRGAWLASATHSADW